MSQVVSRGGRSDVITQNPWKKSCLVAFHGAAAATYGYAICWQNVSG